MNTDTQSVDDRALVTQALQGNQCACTELYNRYYEYVRGVCGRYCFIPADADEAAQLTMFRFYRGLPQFEWRSSLKTYLHNIAYHTALERQKREERRGSKIRVSLDAKVREDVKPLMDGLLDPGDMTGFQLVESEELSSVLAATIAALPDNQRELYNARASGMAYEHMATTFNVPQGTVKSRLSRIRCNIARAVLARYPEYTECFT